MVSQFELWDMEVVEGAILSSASSGGQDTCFIVVEFAERFIKGV